jgi:hypothetical protein
MTPEKAWMLHRFEHAQRFAPSTKRLAFDGPFVTQCAAVRVGNTHCWAGQYFVLDF